MSRALRPLLLAAVAALLLVCVPAWAGNGGCPMCKESAAALGDDGQQALNVGIFMLMGAVALALGTLGWLLLRRIRTDAIRHAVPGLPPVS